MYKTSIIIEFAFLFVLAQFAAIDNLSPYLRAGNYFKIN